MGKRWRKYEVGRYRLGVLRAKDGRDEAVVCWRDGDGKHRHRLGVFSEGEGRTAVDSFVGRVEALKARDTQTVGDIFKAYVADREKDGKLIATFRDNWKALAPRFADLKVADVNADVCRDYTTGRTKQGRSAGTIWTELTRLRSAINWAFKRRVITTCPYVWVPKKPDPKQRVLSQEEVWRLTDAATAPHVKLFIGLALATGGRSEAVLGLKWTQVDFGDDGPADFSGDGAIGGTIDLREKAVINPLTKKVRKGRAVVPMSAGIRAMLTVAKSLALTDYVIEWDGAPVKKIRKGFSAAVERAGLGEYAHAPTAANWHNVAWWSDVTPHTLRHTVASAGADADVPMLKISRFLGHRDQATTEKIYAKTRPDFVSDMTKVVSIRRGKKAG